MPDVILSEKLLADLAGWEVIKRARALVADQRVLSSNWTPPVLKGVVKTENNSVRAGLVIRRENDAENLCPCRESREWGTLCAHSIAIGLHALKPGGTTPSPSGAPGSASPRPGLTPVTPVPAKTRPVRRLRRAEAGTPAESITLHVVLPPNFADGIVRGKGTVFFEAQTAKGRVPLSSVPVDRPVELDAADTRLLDAAEALAGGDTPAMLQVSTAEFATLLSGMVDHPRVTLAKTRNVSISDQPWRTPLRARIETNGEITLQCRALAKPPAVVPGDKCWVIEGPNIRRLGLPTECLPVLAGPMKWNRLQVPAFVSSLLPQLERDADLEKDFSVADFDFSPRPPTFQLHLAGGLATLSALLQCTYGSRVMTIGVSSTDEAHWLPDPAHPKRYATRDLVAEQSALERLRRHGFTGPDDQGRYNLHGQNQVLTFFAREFARLEREWNVTLEERLDRSTRQNLERIEPQLAVTPSGEQWFDLRVTYATSAGISLPASEIQRLLRGGQSHTRLPNGRIALIDTGAVEELEEILVDCAPNQADGAYRMSQAQAGFLETSLRRNGTPLSAPESWRQRTRQQTGEVDLTCPPLGPLETVLRPYQRQGVAWLGFLRRNEFGGILADEMGLGKTLQTLAHLSTLARETSSNTADSSEPQRPIALVVCPTSLVSNWIAEAARFTPELRALAMHGPNRKSHVPRLRDCDLVVTSYALVRRDMAWYRDIEFDTVILDEAQHIKNRQTQNAQAVKAIRSRNRVVLTGTPMENSVLDLWSIFDFLMPGYLGSAQEFRDRYEIPITREKCEATQARLARRIRPFLLRRLKRDVAPELPPRIDQVVWCDLTDSQGAIYQQLLESTRRKVTEAVGAQGLAKSRMLVLTALLRLRQVCCDLRLLKLEATDPDVEGTEPSAPHEGPTVTVREPSKRASAESSGKVAAFAELIEEVVDGGHRVLVFSQFTGMLSLLKEHLERSELPYAYLDGSTRDRAAAVASFQDDPEIPVFLISLKAGGVGLNLTAADTVIHFDPWWNPAVEDQASDRAHRIGQTRVVTSYKLITRGTVEEKILSLQQRKRDIIRGLISGEEQLSEALTWDEIQELLS
ncbi:MAG: SNF2 helicase associated domain-containing protein [Verrucomicrobiales bacterium]|nr:SNF2 helicase associated domain-containing protein [Verrucomicrobiales bacterium]